MSYLEALNRAHDKQRTRARTHERTVKSRHFEVDDLDADLFEHDEPEIEAIRESSERYAISH